MKLLSLASLAFAVSGCASITTGHNQVISVETKDKGEAISGASCTLVNPKGKYFVTSPGTVTIRRAYDDLNVTCEKEGLEPGLLTAKSSTKAMAFGNILFGGIIGGAVDVGSGAAYDYPPLITVLMGETTIANPQPANSADNTPEKNGTDSENTKDVEVKTKDWSKPQKSGQ
jgi:hypothetical protein